VHGVDNVGTVPAALTAYLALQARPPHPCGLAQAACAQSYSAALLCWLHVVPHMYPKPSLSARCRRSGQTW